MNNKKDESKISQTLMQNQNLTPFYKIYVYGEDNDRIEEIFINPKINNTLGGQEGIYSIISSKFGNQYTPMKHIMKIKFNGIWYSINDINIYNFCVSGNLSSGDNILIKLLKNNFENINKNNNIDGIENNNPDEDILEANKIKYKPVPPEKQISCSLCRQNSEYLYNRLLKLFGPFKFRDKNYYAHFLCLIFIPEIQILDDGGFKDPPGRIINYYVKFKCAFCGEKGATLCCCYINTKNYNNPLNIKCSNRFHYLCAIKSGCLISNVTYNVLCPKHINYGYPSKIEEKKEEEINQIIIDNNNDDNENNDNNENNEDEKNEEENKINISENEIMKNNSCFYCKLIINEEECLQCSKCKNYFHEACVGIKHNEDMKDNNMEIEEFICPDCFSKGNITNF